MQFFCWQFIKRGLIPTTLIVFFCLIPAILPAKDTPFLHASKISDDLFDVSFPDETYGWACGRWGAVLNTSDGGKSWVRQKSGTDYTLSSIHFIDRENGWAVGDRATILHTSDGGNTWEKQQSPSFVVDGRTSMTQVGVVTAEEESTAQVYFMGVHFVNKLKGWIVAERTNILFTKDGGKTWKIQFKDEDFILKNLSFCDEKNGWAVGEYGYTYHTSDGGKRWEKQAGSFDFSEETGEIIGGSYLFDVVAVNPQTAWVAGIGGYVARTTDGGGTWQKMTKGLPNTHLFGITQYGQGPTVVVGKGVLRVIPESSETFLRSKIDQSIKYGWIYGVTTRGDAGFAAVGGSGWIYISDRNGTSWKRVAGR